MKKNTVSNKSALLFMKVLSMLIESLLKQINQAELRYQTINVLIRKIQISFIGGSK